VSPAALLPAPPPGESIGEPPGPPGPPTGDFGIAGAPAPGASGGGANGEDGSGILCSYATLRAYVNCLISCNFLSHGFKVRHDRHHSLVAMQETPAAIAPLTAGKPTPPARNVSVYGSVGFRVAVTSPELRHHATPTYARSRIASD